MRCASWSATVLVTRPSAHDRNRGKEVVVAKAPEHEEEELDEDAAGAAGSIDHTR